MGPDDREHTFLSVTGAKFITDDRVSAVSDRVAETDVVRVFLVSHESDRLYPGAFLILVAGVLRPLQNGIVDDLIGFTLLEELAQVGKTIAV